MASRHRKVLFVLEPSLTRLKPSLTRMAGEERPKGSWRPGAALVCGLAVLQRQAFCLLCSQA